MKSLILAGAVVALAFSAPALASEEKKPAEAAGLQRAGSCEDAKAQMTYWCEERQSISVISMGLECDNAKKNVAEACEGEETEDQVYK